VTVGIRPALHRPVLSLRKGGFSAAAPFRSWPRVEEPRLSGKLSRMTIEIIHKSLLSVFLRD
jgi:hypothetical protein